MSLEHTVKVAEITCLMDFFCYALQDMDDEPAACVVCLCEKNILIAQEGLNCAVDGFVRLLARIDIAHMSQATGVFTAERSACVIKNGEKLEWLFMRSPDEVDRLLGQLNQFGVASSIN